MAKPQPRMAIVYDFDGTLAPGNMQEQSFLPAVESDANKFWGTAKFFAKQHDMDEILAYMELMLDESNNNNKPITREAFKSYGKQIQFYEGVEAWFDRITDYGRQHKVKILHYVISSGNKETIEGTAIAGKFEKIFASCFRYDQNGVAVWPAVAINYTNKAQFLFRINKGIDNVHDNTKINQYTPQEERPFPFKNFVYIGDGETDIPAMKMVTYQGGRSIVVFDRRRGKKQAAHTLVEQARADIAVPADYKNKSKLEKAVMAAIRAVAARHEFEQCDSSPLKGKRPPK